MCFSGNRVNTLVYPREKRHLPLGRTSFLVDNAKVGHESPRFSDAPFFLPCKGCATGSSLMGGNYINVYLSVTAFQVVLQSTPCKQARKRGVTSAKGLFLSSFFVSPRQKPYLCSVNLTRGGLCLGKELLRGVQLPLSVLFSPALHLSAFSAWEGAL